MKHKYAIGLGFSSACNMNCTFCYSKSKRTQEQDIDLNIWYDFFHRNAEYINSINYGTGENTTSNNWYQLIVHIRDCYPHIRQALTTNGYLSQVMRNDSSKRQIVLHTIDEVDVSLDFGDAQTHNAYRGNINAFKWANETLAFCRISGLLSTIVTLGIDETLRIDNMEKIFDIARRYNAKVRVNLYRPVNKKSRIRPASLSAILNFFDWVNQHHRILSISDPLFSTLLCAGKVSPDPSGSSSLRITQDGNIYPSTYLLYDDFLMGNVRDFSMNMNLAWNDKTAQFLNVVIPEACRTCRYMEQCKGGVLDRRFIWYGSLAQKDPYCFVDKADLLRNYIQHKASFTSVHDGYLPTLFFQSGKGNNYDK